MTNTNAANQRMTDQEIEGLIINAEDGEVFGGLSKRESIRFREIAEYNGRGVAIEAEDKAWVCSYRATVVF